MPSQTEQVLQAVQGLLNAISAVTKTVDRGGEVPARLDQEAHYVLLDGDPGELDGPLLGDEPPYYYQHDIEVEVFVQHANEATRRALFDTAIQAIETGFEADPTLGGLIKGFAMRRPEAIEDKRDGAEPIKAASLSITVEYQSHTRL